MPTFGPRSPVAACIGKALRAHDIVARWGGEEFICLLPETDAEGAINVSEKLRVAIETYTHCHGEVSIAVTVTLGVCVFDGAGSIEACINRADSALYKGKERGRNQVVMAD